MAKLLSIAGVFVSLAIQSFAGSFVITGQSDCFDPGLLEKDRARILRQIGEIGPDNLPPIEIRVARSQSEFDSMAGPHFPQWGLAAASRRGSRILVRPGACGADLHQTLVHELTHVLLHQTDQGAYLPRWFHEGLAMTFAGEVSFEENIQVARAALAGNLLILDQIENVNTFHSAKALLAYAQSHLAVSLLVRKHGPDVIPEIIVSVRKHRDFWGGVEDVLSMNRKEWEKFYQDELRKEYAWIFLFSDFWVFWILLAVGFFGVIFVKKRQNKKILEKWEKEEGEDLAEDANVKM